MEQLKDMEKGLKISSISKKRVTAIATTNNMIITIMDPYSLRTCHYVSLATLCCLEELERRSVIASQIALSVILLSPAKSEMVLAKRMILIWTRLLQFCLTATFVSIRCCSLVNGLVWVICSNRTLA